MELMLYHKLICYLTIPYTIFVFISQSTVTPPLYYMPIQKSKDHKSWIKKYIDTFIL